MRQLNSLIAIIDKLNYGADVSTESLHAFFSFALAASEGDWMNLAH
jgi:hypothetical protein